MNVQHVAYVLHPNVPAQESVIEPFPRLVWRIFYGPAQPSSLEKSGGATASTLKNGVRSYLEEFSDKRSIIADKHPLRVLDQCAAY
jgi:hypothetical protein